MTRFSRWDATLPSVEMRNVHLRGESFQSAWENMGRDFMIRSVAYIPADPSLEHPFDFQAGKCTVRDVFEALVAAYPQVTWTMDHDFGIAWFHPVSVSLAQLLSQPVTADQDEFGVPMLSGVLSGVSQAVAPTIVLRPGEQRFVNTFDFPVDIPAGTYTARAMINWCCLANPMVAFGLSEQSDKSITIWPLNLQNWDIKACPSGALHLWRTEVDAGAKMPPSEEEVVEALSSLDSRVRSAAQIYMTRMMFASWPYDDLIATATNRDRALWVAVAAMRIFNLTAQSPPHPASIERIKRECNDQFFRTSESQLAISVAIELARVAGDTRGLEIVSKRRLTEAEILPVRSHVVFGARSSRLVRDMLVSSGSSWLGLGNQAVSRLRIEPVFR
jgi:hypothetical protein